MIGDVEDAVPRLLAPRHFGLRRKRRFEVGMLSDRFSCCGVDSSDLRQQRSYAQLELHGLIDLVRVVAESLVGEWTVGHRTSCVVSFPIRDVPGEFAEAEQIGIGAAP